MNWYHYAGNSLITVGTDPGFTVTKKAWSTCMQLEDKFTDFFSYIFNHTNEVYYKCFSDVQENDDGYYELGYISVKIVNEFIRESVIESVYLNCWSTGAKTWVRKFDLISIIYADLCKNSNRNILQNIDHRYAIQSYSTK